MPSSTRDLAATGPGTLAGRYLRMFWQPVYRLEDLRPGRAKPIRVMGEDFTLYRGESGAVYVVAARCGHRGTQLSIGWVEGETIRCRYHGWRYGGDGRCVEQPAERDQQFCDRVRLRHCPVRLYSGLVFAYFGEGAAPDFPTYPELEGDGVIEPIYYPRRCNYFNGIDNLFDESHVVFTHREFFREILEIPTITYERLPGAAMLHSARPGKGVRTRQFLMPNVLRLRVPTGDDRGVGWCDYVNWRVPVDDHAHDTFGVRYVDLQGEARERYLERLAQQRALPAPPVDELADRVLGGQMTIEEAKAAMGDHDTHYEVFLEDHVTQIGQGVVAERAAECLGIADVGVKLLRELWFEELDRVARGEPPHRWTLPPPVKISSGIERVA